MNIAKRITIRFALFIFIFSILGYCKETTTSSTNINSIKKATIVWSDITPETTYNNGYNPFHNVNLNMYFGKGFDDLNLKMYFNQGYEISSFHIWDNDTVPAAIIVLDKLPNEPGARSQGPEVHAILFKYQKSESNSEKKWQIVNETKLSVPGMFGELRGIPRFIKIGPKKYGFMIDSFFNSNGESTYGTTIYGIINDNFTEIANIITHDDNEQAADLGKEAENYSNMDSKIFMLIDPSREVYNIVVQTESIHNTAKGEPAANEESEVLYFFQDGKYITASPIEIISNMLEALGLI